MSEGSAVDDEEQEQQLGLTKHKKIAFTAIEQQVHELNEIGEDLWRIREVPGMEERSMRLISNFLLKKGFKVQEHYMGFQNSFRAEFGEDEDGGAAHPNIALLCQYDADADGAGHTRGHNLVVVNALAAALGLQCVVKFATEPMGKVTVVGCPSNLDGTMKTAMFERGFFRLIDFVLCAYPAHYTNTLPAFVGSKTYSLVYKGKKSHSNERPWEAASAVSASVMAYQNVSTARQQFRSDWNVHGVIQHAGEKADSQVDYARSEWLLQAPRPEEMKQLDNKVKDCFRAAATASGCRFDVRPMKTEFLANVPCPRLQQLYHTNAKLNGFTFHNMSADLEGPDDIASVSTSVPVYKVIYYCGDSSKPGTDEFNRYVGSKNCQFMCVVQGKTLAMMAVDLMTSDQDMKVVFEQHQSGLATLYSGVKPEIQQGFQQGYT